MKDWSIRRLSVAAALLLGVGCASAHEPRPITGVRIPIEDTTPRKRAPRREPPPAPGSLKPYRSPRVASGELPNGVRFAIVTDRALPAVHVRAVVAGGRATDGERTGLAQVTALALVEGGDLAARLDAAGAAARASVDADSISVDVAAPADRLAEAVDLLGATILRPRFDPAAIERVKRREIARVEEAARASAPWAASMVLHRDLFALPSDQHPYAAFDATPADLAKITAEGCRAMHRRHFVPKSTLVVVAGDAAPDAAKAAVEKVFGAARGGEAPVISFTDPMPPEALKITVVDRPGSAAVEVFVGALGPTRLDKTFAPLAVGAQILGGPAGRVARDLAGDGVRADAALHDFAHGPSLLVVRAAGPAGQAGRMLQAILDHAERLGTTAPEEDEVRDASLLLGGGLAVRLASPGAIAGEIGHLRLLGLPDDHDDAFAREIAEATPAVVLRAMSANVRSGHEIVVAAGDASILGPALGRFGEVKVLDPARGFERVRTVPRSRGATPGP